MKFEFSVDRGGTFTDIFCCIYSNNSNDIYDKSRKLIKTDRLKILSEDSNYPDSISEGIKKMLEKNLDIQIKEKIPSKYISSVRIGTTIGTNALLERKGVKTALVMTKGFKDLLNIGNQSRPKIFELNIKKFESLFSDSIEIDERVEVVSNIEKNAENDENLEEKSLTFFEKNNDKVDKKLFNILKVVEEQEVKQQLVELKNKGIESLAISLMHSYAFPDHENIVKKIAEEIGFNYVFVSHESCNKIGYLTRSSTCLLDAYLFPVIKTYLNSLINRFDDNAESFPIYLMQSDGFLVPIKEFTGSKSILSGPAGGISGYSLTSLFEEKNCENSSDNLISYNNSTKKLIGFDMGGTSTDVSTFEGVFEMNYESEIAGTFISTPHLDINTVAAGGGSCISYKNTMLTVGPESAGSNPGPVCYGKVNGKLAITDINLILGRVIPKYFPSIFGENRDQPLNKLLSLKKFEELVNEIKLQDESFKEKSIEEVAYGYIRVANEVMCRPIRALTEARGKDPKKFDLAIFGGAGAQHGCAIADILGIKRIFVHKYSSILSAYGIFLSDITKEADVFINQALKILDTKNVISQIIEKVNYLKKDKNDINTDNQLEKNICIDQSIDFYNEEIEISFLLKYEGSEGLITVNTILPDIVTENLTKEINFEDIEKRFSDSHKEMFGFTLENRNIILSSLFIKLKHKRKSLDEFENSEILQKNTSVEDFSKLEYTEAFFYNSETSKLEKVKTPVYLEENLTVGCLINGPAIVLINGSSIIVENNWSCYFNKKRNFELNKNEALKITQEKIVDDKCIKDSVMLSIFGQRFMSIAEQMGRRLQRTALSTNIKERLDFSCAIFGPDGSLVANAPHLPVHLGSMESTVTYQIETLKDNFKANDVVISNHPAAGGSHLPDITAITPCFFNNKPIFYVASRGHHADIGGKTPGSMPSFAELLSEEGVAFKSFKIIDNGEFKEKELVEQLTNPSSEDLLSDEKIIGSRNVAENISDLKAQVASNAKGVALLLNLVEEYGLTTVHNYMNFIQEAAEHSVREMLCQISENNGLNEIDTISEEDYMDDGTAINLKLTINRLTKSAIFDFTNSGYQVLGNFNTPMSVVRSAIIYCLRCMVNSDIPLNAGCLRPVNILIKKGSILHPSDDAAIVGGNVTTSQRITDVILKAFKVVADSQGCMNNLTFGNERFGYYETIAGGSGAGSTFNGVDAVQTHMTNTRITDPEILETRFPVILTEFSIRKQSGGKGIYNGGNGVIREFIFKQPLSLSILSERRVLHPQGICGGSDGEKGINLLYRKKTQKNFEEVKNDNCDSANFKIINVGGKCSTKVFRGDKFRVETPGGGGYGCSDSIIKNNKLLEKNSDLNVNEILIYGSLNSYQKTQEQS